MVPDTRWKGGHGKQGSSASSHTPRRCSMTAVELSLGLFALFGYIGVRFG